MPRKSRVVDFSEVPDAHGNRLYVMRLECGAEAVEYVYRPGHKKHVKRLVPKEVWCGCSACLSAIRVLIVEAEGDADVNTTPMLPLEAMQ
jgi:hypothetical protein